MRLKANESGLRPQKRQELAKFENDTKTCRCYKHLLSCLAIEIQKCFLFIPVKQQENLATKFHYGEK